MAKLSTARRRQSPRKAGRLSSRLAQLKRLTLAQALDQSPFFDPLAEALWELLEALEERWPLGDFIDFCQDRGLGAARLEAALRDRAEFYDPRAGPGPAD